MSSAQPAAGTPATLDELLALHDEGFVRSAYQCVLGRGVDEGGLNDYLRQVRQGADKWHIVADLALSEEGLRAGHHLPGLVAALRSYRRPVTSRLRALMSRLLRPGLADTERQLRAIDNRLAMLAAAQEATLAQLRDEIRSLAARVEGAGGESTPSAAVGPARSMPAMSGADEPERLGARARAIVRLIERARAQPVDGA